MGRHTTYGLVRHSKALTGYLAKMGVKWSFSQGAGASAALAHPIMHADLHGPFPEPAQQAPTHSTHSRRHPPAQKSMTKAALWGGW
jgi:hypothetical protein